jgi:putative flippase GtrA
MASMYLLVDLLQRPLMPSKMLTTAAMMGVSFTLSKTLTFNKRLLEGA